MSFSGCAAFLYLFSAFFSHVTFFSSSRPSLIREVPKVSRFYTQVAFFFCLAAHSVRFFFSTPLVTWLASVLRPFFLITVVISVFRKMCRSSLFSSSRFLFLSFFFVLVVGVRPRRLLHLEQQAGFKHDIAFFFFPTLFPHPPSSLCRRFLQRSFFPWLRKK